MILISFLKLRSISNYMFKNIKTKLINKTNILPLFILKDLNNFI